MLPLQGQLAEGAAVASAQHGALAWLWQSPAASQIGSVAADEISCAGRDPVCSALAVACSKLFGVVKALESQNSPVTVALLEDAKQTAFSLHTGFDSGELAGLRPN